MRRIPKPSPAMIVALVGVALGLGGLAFATIPDSSGTIHGCYGPQGNLRVVESTAGCRNSETPLSWNQQGPPGAGVVKSALVRLSIGETKPVLTAGPFTLSAACSDIGSGTNRVVISVRSSEAGWILRGGDPRAANTDFVMHSYARFGNQPEWQPDGEVNLIAPSGAQVTTVTSEGVKTFGADCAVAAMTIG